MYSLAGRYEYPIPPQFLAPIDFLKIPALDRQESPAGTRQTDGKNLVWFGELEKILAVLPLNYFMVGKKTLCQVYIVLHLEEGE